MAKLLAYYNLCPINNVEDFLGLSRDVDPGCVINTLGKNIVLVVKLSNQRQIRSWTVIDRLSSKVVYDFQSERYVGVFGGRYIRCWSRDQPDINTAKKVKLYRSVLDLFSLSNGHTLVLYTDGSCESLESALETRKQAKLNPNDEAAPLNVNPKTHTIRDVQILVLDNGIPLLTYFVRKEEDGSMELNYALLNPADLKMQNSFVKIALQRHGGDLKLVGNCIVDGSDGPSLLSIWSDSRIFNLLLPLGQSPKREEGVGNFIEMIHMINVKQPLSLTSIGKDYVAFYANNKNQDGAIMVLFNVQFKVFQAKQFFKVYLGSSRFWVVESNILLAVGQMLAVVPFKISKKQLSDMIGSQRTFDLEHTIDDESINEECEVLDSYCFFENLPKSFKNLRILAEANSDNEVDNKKDVKPTEPLYNHRVYNEALLATYRETLPVDVIECSSLPQDIVQIKLFNNADLTLGPLILSENYEPALEELERSGYSEMEISDRIVPLFIQEHQTADLAKCLKRYSVISERTIVRALSYALSLPIPELDAAPSVKKEELELFPEVKTELPNQDIIVEAQANHASHYDLLNVVLSCSFNRNAIIPHIRREIAFPTVMVLLKHLEYLLVDPMATLSETLHTVENFDSDEQVVQWIAVLLDSHYQQFILATEDTVRDQLQRLLDIVERHVGLLNQLRTLFPYLHRAMQLKPQKSGAVCNQWYDVESVTLY